MTTHIEAETLTTFEVTGDGSRLTLNAENADGVAMSLSLPAECLSQMMMTLPRMAQTALRRRHGDDSLRIVYPTATCRIEQSPGAGDTFIMTLCTTDGFEVSFGVDQAQLASMKQSVRDAAATPQIRPRLN